MNAPAIAGVALLSGLSFPTWARSPLPDLVVASVKLSPEHPNAGQSVRMSATVSNTGAGPTPEGVVVGGVFRVNGQVYSYTDTYTHAVAPGESITLSANGGGGAGDGTWLARPGTYSFGFLVDDINRLRESDKTNNDYTDPVRLVVTESRGPVLSVTRLAWAAGPGNRITFRATVANAGLTAPGRPARVRFWLDGRPMTATALPTGTPAARGTVTASGTVSVPGGRHTVRAEVEPSAEIVSQTDGPNALSRQFWVRVPFWDKSRPADAFADSVGVCTHLSYFDTAYGNYDVIKKRLVESGIRTLRDGAGLNGGVVLDRFRDLAKSGVRACLLTDPRRQPPADVVTLVKLLKPAVVMVEGPNEPNLFTPDLFPDGIRDYQTRLYAALKADPQTAALPVLSPALAFPHQTAPRLGPVPCDFGAMHPYPGGQLPDLGLDDALRDTAILAPRKPLMITETGYDTALHVTNGQPAVSEAAEAKYLPRLLLEAFRRGISHTFLYEFSDERAEPAMHDAENHFGLIHADGTPKPAYTAIKNMIALLSDRSPLPARPRRPGAFSIVTEIGLSGTLTGDTTDLRHLVLEKRDGRRYLILWTNGRSFDQDAKIDAAVPPQSVTLRLTVAVPRVALFYPSRSAAPAARLGRTQTLTLEVSDEPLVVELAAAP